MSLGHGDVWIGVPVRRYTECNTTVELPICFPSGEIHSITFYVTLLDVSCSAVLRHSWLTRYNPLIDWVLSSISFWPLKETESMAPSELVTPVLLTSIPPSPATNIAWVIAAALSTLSYSPSCSYSMCSPSMEFHHTLPSTKAWILYRPSSRLSVRLWT